MENRTLIMFTELVPIEFKTGNTGALRRESLILG